MKLNLFRKKSSTTTVPDVDKRESQEETFESRRHELETLGLMAASIEHDVKNPLGVLESEIYMLRQILQAAHPSVIARLDRIDEQRKRIFAAVSVIPLLRGDREYWEQFIGKTDVAALLSRSVRDVKLTTYGDNIFFKRKFPPGIHVNAYPSMLEQAIVNILNNAVDAIHEAKRKSGVIEIRAKADHTSPESVRIEIIDNGCGIPDANFEKLTSFFSTKDRNKPNSGLGLFIAHRIISLHHGRFEIRNNEMSDGVIVAIILPRATNKRQLD